MVVSRWLKLCFSSTAGFKKKKPLNCVIVKTKTCFVFPLDGFDLGDALGPGKQCVGDECPEVSTLH